jgi:hypothetical protein
MFVWILALSFLGTGTLGYGAAAAVMSPAPRKEDVLTALVACSSVRPVSKGWGITHEEAPDKNSDTYTDPVHGYTATRTMTQGRVYMYSYTHITGMVKQEDPAYVYAVLERRYAAQLRATMPARSGTPIPLGKAKEAEKKSKKSVAADMKSNACPLATISPATILARSGGLIMAGK